MLGILSFPSILFKFWFFEAPVSLVEYFASLNNAFLELFSLPLLVRTYFKPWKNEYRKDFIMVAIGLSIIIKTFIILADLLLFLLLIVLELIFILAFLAWPIATVLFLFR